MRKYSVIVIFAAVMMLSVPFSTSVFASIEGVPIEDPYGEIYDGFGTLAERNNEIHAAVDYGFSTMAEGNTEIHQEIQEWIAPYAEGNFEIHDLIDEKFEILSERNTEIHGILVIRISELGEINSMVQEFLLERTQEQLDQGVPIVEIRAQNDEYIGLLAEYNSEIHSQIIGLVERLAEHNNEIHEIIIYELGEEFGIDVPEPEKVTGRHKAILNLLQNGDTGNDKSMALWSLLTLKPEGGGHIDLWDVLSTGRMWVG